MPRRPDTIRSRGYLPHWEALGATYSVTFRLWDALPQSILEGYIREREDILETAEYMGRALTAIEHARLAELHSEKIEAYLDQGIGECYLRRPEVGRIVFNALKHFHAVRYDVHSWCVMPNHVHVMFTPIAPYTLAQIAKSWKSFTAHAANEVLGRSGAFWMPEYFDHMVRDRADFEHHYRYIQDNPRKAGLKDWAWVGHTDVLPTPLLAQ